MFSVEIFEDEMGIVIFVERLRWHNLRGVTCNKLCNKLGPYN